MAPVRVFLADDHPMFTEGLARSIAEHAGMEVVGTATDGRESIAGIRRLRPDVAVLDVKMPELTGVEVIQEIVRESLPTRVLLLSALADEAMVLEGIASGAGGYLIKDASRSDIIAAIEAVAEGRAVLAPAAQTALTSGVRSRFSERRPVITEREREALRLTAEGMSAAQIGAQLHLSPATVKAHLSSVYEKLGVSERAAAVATAMRLGLLE
jgi:two-component system nitrate/nitrite response regulator NarL